MITCVGGKIALFADQTSIFAGFKIPVLGFRESTHCLVGGFKDVFMFNPRWLG
jgi:hypothetical protein